MGLEKKIEQFKAIRADSLSHVLTKAWDFLYIINVGGTLIRRYQKPCAEKLGWEEKDLTIRNAVYCGILPAIGYAILNQSFGDNVGESFQKNFNLYPAFLFTVSSLRTAYAMSTKKSIGAFSIYNAVGTSAYAIREAINSFGKEKEETEKAS